MLKLNRGNTWNFTFKKRANSTAPYDNLNGLTILFTIKKKKDTNNTDTGAVYTATQVISTSVTSYTFTLPPASTKLEKGMYVYGFRWKVGGVEKTADSDFECVLTTTNRSS